MFTIFSRHPKIVNLYVTVFMLGRSPWAPGTVGTLAGPVVVILMSGLSALAYMGITLFVAIFSMAVIDIYQATTGTQDGSEIVIDEVLGYMVAMTLLPLNWLSLLSAFLIFRFFDIVKPFPIGYMDKKIKGGMGVVVDDLAAGLVTNMILHVLWDQQYLPLDQIKNWG